MSDQAGILPKWFSHQGIILAKGQLDHSYTIWAIPIFIFSPVCLLMRHPLPRIGLWWSIIFIIFFANFIQNHVWKSKKNLASCVWIYLVDVKFMFSKKATKINEIFTVDLTFCSERQIDGEDFVNFCGLLRKHKRYVIKLGSWYFRNILFLEMKYILLWFLEIIIFQRHFVFITHHRYNDDRNATFVIWQFFLILAKKKLDNVSHRFPGNYCQSAIKSITVTIWHGEFNDNCWIFWKSFFWNKESK